MEIFGLNVSVRAPLEILIYKLWIGNFQMKILNSIQLKTRPETRIAILLIPRRLIASAYHKIRISLYL